MNELAYSNTNQIVYTGALAIHLPCLTPNTDQNSAFYYLRFNLPSTYSATSGSPPPTTRETATAEEQSSLPIPIQVSLSWSCLSQYITSILSGSVTRKVGLNTLPILCQSRESSLEHKNRKWRQKPS